MRKLFSQILNDVKEAAPEDKAIQLKLNETGMLRQLLLSVFDPNCKYDVIIPTFRINQEVDGYSSNNLYVEFRRMYIFLDSYNKVSPKRKSGLLAQILESIDPADAEALIMVIKKDLSEYGLTKEIVNEAFPGLVK